MEIDSERHEEMVPSPPHPPAVQRETIEPIDPIDLVDPVAPVDVPRDIAVGRRDLHGLVKLCRRQKDMQLLVVPSERERDLKDICVCAATMSHIIDSEPSCYEEASSQPVWRDAMMEEYQSIMKNDVWILF
jgi:hypothetical protein